MPRSRISNCAARVIAAQSGHWREARMRSHHPALRGPMLVLAMVCVIGGTAAAQWLSLPLPGTPRTPDGKPNLNAPTPRAADGKPDLSGIWRTDSPRYNENLLPPG